jgi:hypothetical protein
VGVVLLEAELGVVPDRVGDLDQQVRQLVHT